MFKIKAEPIGVQPLFLFIQPNNYLFSFLMRFRFLRLFNFNLMV
jgi:hypothetical protein